MNDLRRALKKIIANIILTNKSGLSGERSGLLIRMVRDRLCSATRDCLSDQFRLHRNNIEDTAVPFPYDDQL